MEPIVAELSAYNSLEEPWRINRLIRLDGRVRELLRIVTPDAEDADCSLGEQYWTRHVRGLNDERGTLQVSVSEALGASGWLAVIALAVSRGWDGEDESDVEFLVEGEPLPWPLASILAPP